VSPTCVNPTCVSPTCVSPTCVNPTCVSPTCVNPTCVSPTCVNPTCVSPTCVNPTCVSPTCVSPTCVNPTCVSPTCVSPTCVNPTCVSPTCVSPTCVCPTCVSPTCVNPTCVSPTCFPTCVCPTCVSPTCVESGWSSWCNAVDLEELSLPASSHYVEAEALLPFRQTGVDGIALQLCRLVRESRYWQGHRDKDHSFPVVMILPPSSIYLTFIYPGLVSLKSNYLFNLYLPGSSLIKVKSVLDSPDVSQITQIRPLLAISMIDCPRVFTYIYDRLSTCIHIYL
uniref:Uncharacterized protein n=1 Tax=Salmo trutta TaxID=8032 RepID=A0A673WWN8_SALTR